MSAILLIPGNGGAYISEAFAAAGTGADTIDVSRCTGIEIQQTPNSVAAALDLGGTFAVEETVDNVNWAPLGAAVTVTNAPPFGISKFESGSRPMHRIRFNMALVTGLDSTHTLQITMVGGAIGSGLF